MKKQKPRRKRRKSWEIIIEDEINPEMGEDIRKWTKTELLKYIAVLWEEIKECEDRLEGHLEE